MTSENTAPTYKVLIHNGTPHYGKQLLASATGCNDLLRDMDYMSRFLARLPTRVGMRAFGDPILHRFGEGPEVGISGVQLLYSSAVVLHTNDRFGDLYLDLFSCRDFDESDVMAYLTQVFSPGTAQHQIIFRY